MPALRIFILLFLLTTAFCTKAGDQTESLQKLIEQVPLAESELEVDSIMSRIDNTITSLAELDTINRWDSLISHFQVTDNLLALGYCYYYKAISLDNNGEYFWSRESYFTSLEIFEELNYKRGLGNVNNGLGILFRKLERFEQSEYHFNQAIDYYTDLDNNLRLGFVYLNLGGMHETQGLLEDAKSYLKVSQAILESLNDSNLIHCYINLGVVFQKQEVPDSAEYYFTRSYEISTRYGNVEDKFQASYHLGDFLFNQNRTQEAEPYLMRALSLLQQSEETNSIPVEFFVWFYKLLSDFYAKQEDFIKAYASLSLSNKYAAEIKKDQSIIDIGALEYEQLENETELKHKRQNLYIGLILAGLVISVLILLSFYKGYRNKQRANQILTEMDELKSRLFSDITHELRTPLTLILGPLEQMLSSEIRKAPDRRQIKMMRRNANTVLSLVNQMLDLSKLEAKSLKLELTEKDIVKFLRIRFTSFQSMAEQRNIRFNCYCPPDKKVRLFDEEKLEKIINNLISNALKFTRSDGQVFCFASFPKKNKLELTIQDTGLGIPEEELGKIFDRFHQAKTGGNHAIGTGIGLALTKELVELMHGKISVDSVIGEGTKFKILLPLGKEHLDSSEYELRSGKKTAEKPTIAPASLLDTDEQEVPDKKGDLSDQPQLLIVEDHEEIRRFLKENLQGNYNVVTAENGNRGLEKALETVPDLIVSDLKMPEMDGMEMCKKIKQDQRTSHIPVIILTAQIKTETRLKSFETGADAFLPKPFDLKELNLRIEKLIEQRNKLRLRYTKNVYIEPTEIAVTSADEKFLKKALEVVEKNIGNPEFEVKHFQDEMLMSRMQLFRKVKALTNQTPGEFIRTIRLKRAASLLEQKFGNIAQITYEVGFSNPSYFARCFKELFGKLPSEYVREKVN